MIEMNKFRTLNVGLALVLTLALAPVHAQDKSETEAPGEDAATTIETNRKMAADAVQAAAEEAIESVLEDTRLELDIRLIGPTSEKIASGR
jgi:hypothetical protein